MEGTKVDANKVIEQLRIIISNLTYENVVLKAQLSSIEKEQEEV
jgi:hypothetical protein